MAPDKGLNLYFESGASANSTTPATIDCKGFSASSAMLHFSGCIKIRAEGN
jgi:hypothetical protein